MIRRVAIYARVSTQRQADHGYSIEDQQRRLEQVAERKGWQVVATFVDAGRSGRTTAGREQFRAMLDAADAHQFDALLVQHRDRWARNYLDAGIAHDRLTRLGIAVLDEATADEAERALVRNPERRLVRIQQDVFADYFSDVLGGKTSNGIRRKALLGLHWGDVPFGYRRPDKAEPMVIEESEAAVVRGVFERYATGRHSMADLARWVNAQGFRTRNKRSPEPGLFTNSSIRVILDNPVYAGDLIVDGQRIEARHPAIVSRDLFAEAAAAR
jgi:site-specific DNA recombinase